MIFTYVPEKEIDALVNSYWLDCHKIYKIPLEYTFFLKQYILIIYIYINTKIFDKCICSASLFYSTMFALYQLLIVP